MKAAVFLQTRNIQADHRHLFIAGLFQCLPQKMDVIGRPAASAGLGDHQGSVVQIVLAGIQRVDHLPDDQNCRIAGIVMYVFQTSLGDLWAGGLQQHRLVAVVSKHILDDVKMDRRHHGKQNRIFLFHFLSEQQAPGFVIL